MRCRNLSSCHTISGKKIKSQTKGCSSIVDQTQDLFRTPGVSQTGDRDANEITLGMLGLNNQIRYYWKP